MIRSHIAGAVLMRAIHFGLTPMALVVAALAWLYPARFESQLMRSAARAFVRQGAPVLNVFCHSSEFVPGASAYV